MRTAILSDIHGNLTALEAVIADLTVSAPDLVLHGGDLVGSGGRLNEIIDVVRNRSWPSVRGNTDEMLWRPEKIDRLADDPPQLEPLWQFIRGDIALALA